MNGFEINMWTNKVTKNEYLKRLLDGVISRATRCKRGSDEQDLLLDDLALINKEIERIKTVVDNPKTEFTEFEIESQNLEWFQTGIDKIADSQNSLPAGWRKVGKKSSHFFEENRTQSICKREYRGKNSSLTVEPRAKCAVCKNKQNEKTDSLF